MAGNDRPSRPKGLRGLSNDSPAKAILMTLIVCLVASIVVAGTTVLLRPRQLANKAREQESQYLGMMKGGPGAPAVRGLEARVVDLATGDYVPGMDAARYDQRAASRDPARSVAIPPEMDVAGLKRRAKHAVVRLLMEHGRPQLIVIPVHGKGYASTLYGHLGLSGDGQTVVGLTFFEHGETPGLGARIDDPGWRTQWRGKLVRDETGQLRLGVAEGKLSRDDPRARYEVDALTGATWTSKGVTNMLRYWLGDHGFGPYLNKIAKERR